MIGRDVDDQHLLLFVLMERLGGKIDATQDELADARRKLDEYEVSFVSYEPSRIENPSLTRILMRMRRRQPIPFTLAPPRG
jgi:hypothetical protein